MNTHLNREKAVGVGKNTICVNMTLEPLEAKNNSVINAMANYCNTLLSKHSKGKCT